MEKPTLKYQSVQELYESLYTPEEGWASYEAVNYNHPNMVNARQMWNERRFISNEPRLQGITN